MLCNLSTEEFVRIGLCLWTVWKYSGSKPVNKAKATACCLKDRESILDGSLKFLSTIPEIHSPTETLPWTTPRRSGVGDWKSGVGCWGPRLTEVSESRWMLKKRLGFESRKWQSYLARRYTQLSRPVLFSSRSNPISWTTAYFLFLKTLLGQMHAVHSHD
jgi:hypothetical protein